MALSLGHPRPYPSVIVDPIHRETVPTFRSEASRQARRCARTLRARPNVRPRPNVLSPYGRCLALWALCITRKVHYGPRRSERRGPPRRPPPTLQYEEFSRLDVKLHRPFAEICITVYQIVIFNRGPDPHYGEQHCWPSYELVRSIPACRQAIGADSGSPSGRPARQPEARHGCRGAGRGRARWAASCCEAAPRSPRGPPTCPGERRRRRRPIEPPRRTARA
jgi:hypothetical protein